VRLAIITTLLSSTLLLGVALPAHANGQYYSDECTSLQGGDMWTLALDQDGTRAEFFRETGRVRIGSYIANGDLATITADEMHITLHVASGNASWVAGSAKGTFTCRFISYERPARWQDPEPEPPPFAIPPAPPPPAIAEAPPAPPAGGRICDFEHQCYPDAPPSVTALAPDHVPVVIQDDQAIVPMHVGRLTFNALIDSGATSLSLPETGADGLIASGDAVEDGMVSVKHAGGEVLERRAIIVHSVTVGGHTVHEVHAVVEPDTSQPLIGFRVLRLMAASGKVAINFGNSSLDFN
jgi:hypothetical protein